MRFNLKSASAVTTNYSVSTSPSVYIHVSALRGFIVYQFSDSLSNPATLYLMGYIDSIALESVWTNIVPELVPLYIFSNTGKNIIREVDITPYDRIQFSSTGGSFNLNYILITL